MQPTVCILADIAMVDHGPNNNCQTLIQLCRSTNRVSPGHNSIVTRTGPGAECRSRTRMMHIWPVESSRRRRLSSSTRGRVWMAGCVRPYDIVVERYCVELTLQVSVRTHARTWAQRRSVHRRWCIDQVARDPIQIADPIVTTPPLREHPDECTAAEDREILSPMTFPEFRRSASTGAYKVVQIKPTFLDNVYPI